MSETSRFRDGGSYLYVLADEVLVVCPKCAQRATVTASDTGLTAARRLVCPACGFVQQQPDRSSVWGSRPVDPWFQEDLWLAAPFRNHVVWAYNERHARILRDFVAASLRERGETPVCWGGDRIETMSMIEKLPSWFKAADNRKSLTRVINSLIEKAG